MANKVAVGFEFLFRSDAASSTSTVAINMSGGPIYWYIPADPAPSVNISATVTDVVDLSCTGAGVTATKQSLLLGILTVALSGSLAANTNYYVDGVALF